MEENIRHKKAPPKYAGNASGKLKELGDDVLAIPKKAARELSPDLKKKAYYTCLLRQACELRPGSDFVVGLWKNYNRHPERLTPKQVAVLEKMVCRHTPKRPAPFKKRDETPDIPF